MRLFGRLAGLLFLAGVCVSFVPKVALGQARKIIVHRPNDHKLDYVTPGSTGTVLPPIAYNGGPLIATPNIYYVWYGNWNQTNGSDNAAGKQIMRDFATNIGGSPYFQINTTYATANYPITGSVGFGGETTDNYSRGKTLSDSAVQAVIVSAIQANKLPYDANGVYFVLSSSDVRESSGFCLLYCGWHTAANTAVGHLRYSFVGNAKRCINACAAQSISPNNNPGVDGMASVVAHELEEATTDPDPRSGWVDSGGSENADKCAWTFGQNQQVASNGSVYNMTLGTRKFLIQRNLKHSVSGDTCNVDLVNQ